MVKGMFKKYEAERLSDRGKWYGERKGKTRIGGREEERKNKGKGMLQVENRDGMILRSKCTKLRKR